MADLNRSAKDVPTTRLKQDITSEVKIDGIVRDPATLWAHAQEDPYPGGHRFEVVCFGPDAMEYFKDFPREVRARIDTSKANWLLQLLMWAFPAEKPGSEAHFEWVLNTIDEIVIEDAAVRVSGECSPFLRA